MSKESSSHVRPKKLSLLQVMTSTFAAMFGVQSQAIRERDFTRGNVVQFIIVGVIFTVIFVFALIFIVGLVVK